MKLSPISDEQAWQLFELLEGNLTEPAAKELFKAMQGDANLKAHYEALAQTYLQPTTTIYPDAPSLKKKTSNRTVLFYASMSVAASSSSCGSSKPLSPRRTSLRYNHK